MLLRLIAIVFMLITIGCYLSGFNSTNPTLNLFTYSKVIQGNLTSSYIELGNYDTGHLAWQCRLLFLLETEVHVLDATHCYMSCGDWYTDREANESLYKYQMYSFYTLIYETYNDPLKSCHVTDTNEINALQQRWNASVILGIISLFFLLIHLVQKTLPCCKKKK
jgi:hypothetical protein